MRGRTLALPLAIICLMAGACARLGTRSKAASTPNPSTAIAVSILDDGIYLIDPLTGQRARVVSGLKDFQSGYAAWSPDHTELAYGDHGIYLIDFDTHRHRSIVAGDQLSMPSWSPSGDVIAYGDAGAMWVTPVDVVGPFQVRLPPTVAPVGMDWSLRGIAFQGVHRDCASSSLCPSTDQSDVWIVQSDGTGLRQVTRINHALMPRWAPDASAILFVRKFGGERRQLWIVGAGGTTPRQVGKADDVVAADWSPDGARLAILRTGSQPGTVQLWISRADGSNAQPVGPPIRGTAATVDW